MKIGIIAAMDPKGVIGINGTIPWHFKADFQRFKSLTQGSAIIFGAKTWESIPGFLPGRTCCVLSRRCYTDKGRPTDPGGYYSTLEGALTFARSHTKTDTIWIGGGAEVYREALTAGLVDFIDLTLVPEVQVVDPLRITRFPVDLLTGWEVTSSKPNETEPRLTHDNLIRKVAP